MTRLGSWRRRFLIALACVALCAAPNGRLAAQTSGVATASEPAGSVNLMTLDNGMRIAVAEDPAAPVVSTGMWYRFGATDERPGKTGLAHALAHLMYDGTPFLSGAALDDIVARVGAKETATTANDYTVYRFVLPADKLELAMRVEADRMQHLLIADAAWQKERRAVLSERRSDLAGPLAHLYDQVCLAASASPICALSSLGDEASIRSATSEDVRSYYQDWYVPSNATLVISGDVHTAAVFALAQKIFGDIPRGNPPPRNGVVPEVGQEKEVEVAGDFPYEVVDLAFAAPGRLDPESGAVQIIDSIVNNQRSNFYKALVRSGYTLGYSTQLDQNLHGGLYHVFIIAAPGHTSAQARDAFFDVMKTAEESGFPDDLVRAAKISIDRRETYARDSISGLGESVGYAVAVEGRDSLASSDAGVAKTTARDVTYAAFRYLSTPAVTGLLSPNHTRSPVEPPSTSVTDDFSRRPPAGPVIEAASFRRLVVAPVNLQSRLNPTSFTLPNGLRVLVQEAHANPTVFITGSAQTSPAFDPADKTGIGAMYSTLLDDGTATANFDERHRELDELGATMHLALSFDAHGRSQDFGRLIDLLADGLQHPALDPARVEEVRKDTLGAVRERDEDPDERADNDFDQLMLRPDDPYLRQPTTASVASISTSDLRAYGRRFVRPDLTLITVVGDVDPASVRAKLLAAFGAWHPSGPRPSLDPGPIPLLHPGLRYVVVNRPYAQARLGTPGVSHGAADYPALNVINELLGAGGGFDTRLVDALRVRRELAYRVTSSLPCDRYRGTFEFALGAPSKTIATAVGTLRAELQRLRDEPVGPFELDRARTKIVAGGFVSEESTAVVAARVQQIGADGLPLDYERNLRSLYDKLDGAALLRAANTYLNPASLVEVYEGPQP